ncbi:MAG: hypothetical protein KU28_07565 [Sulfurovum sp. PC08-66]|jgi:hypothetical protein|nr:MAG: hypothetical protein KU28_07565 [Sulfurovum sp. PC08-66]
MTNSIFEKMVLTKENEEALEYATSKEYLKRVKASEAKRAKHKSIIHKPLSKEVQKALLAL